MQVGEVADEVAKRSVGGLDGGPLVLRQGVEAGIIIVGAGFTRVHTHPC